MMMTAMMDQRRGRVVCFVTALLAIALVLARPTCARAQAVERDLFVSVLARSGEPVKDLSPADFTVHEDGMVREVLRARPATDRIDLAVLVDTSDAMTSRVADIRRALREFVDRMRPAGHIAIIGFGERPTILGDYSSDATEIQKGVDRVFPMPASGAYTLDAITETLQGLQKRGAERAAIVVVWAGGHEFSNLSFDNVLDKLAASHVALHVITVSPGAPADALTNEGRNRETVFDRGTTLSGGRRENVLTSMALVDALAKLGDELLNQYRITYARPDTLIPPRRVEVGVRRPGLIARGTPARVLRSGIR
jgi:Ca-activated chloride channel family protein